MTENNSTENELREIIRWAEEVGVDFMRFSMPLKPTHQNFEFKLIEDIAGRLRHRISRLAWEHELESERRAASMKIYLRQDEVVQRSKPFPRCQHCKLIPVIGVRGKVYPCTSTFTADFDHLGIGDINQPGFTVAFWRVWNNPAKWRHDVQKCPDCTRFQYDLNAEIERPVALALGGHSIPGTWSGTRSGRKPEGPADTVVAGAL